jgi:UDP-N-acetylglucosamine 4-epimerase
MVGRMLSPYAATKWVNEIYAATFAQVYGFQSVGLRYFNVFGPRQDPEGAYAAVIPKWISALLRKEPIFINGDGETSRDFVFIGDVVQANLLAATAENPDAVNQVFNVGLGEQTSLNQLFKALKTSLGYEDAKVTHRDFRAGDVRHSVADVSKAMQLLGYKPHHNFAQGLALAMDWYRQNAT